MEYGGNVEEFGVVREKWRYIAIFYVSQAHFCSLLNFSMGLLQGTEVNDAVGTAWMLLLLLPLMMDAYAVAYDHLVANVGPTYADFVLQTVAGLIGQWSVSGVFAFVELVLGSKTLEPWMLQKEKRLNRSDAQYWKGLHLTLVNMVVVAPVLAMGSSLWFWPWRRGEEGVGKPPSSLLELLPYLACFGLVVEIGFYTGHRLCHDIPYLYNSIHTIHHQFHQPVAWTATACHPLEHIFVNILPVAGGPMLCNAHPALNAAWLTYALMTTSFSHSGYSLPFFPSAKAHDWHHERVIECFGVIGILDTLLGTNKEFLQISKEKTTAS